MSSRSPAFQFYPDKWDTHTRHLSDVSYRIFHKIMCWMWLHSPDYFSISVDERKISKLIVESPARVKRAMKEIMDADMPLFKIEDNHYILNGLRKEADKQGHRRNTAAAAAKARWEQSERNANAMRTHSESIPPAMPKPCPPSPTPSPTPIPTPPPENERAVAADAASLPSEKKTRFSPPTVEQVAEYCKEKNYNIDAESFVAFYESKGWKIGTTAMKSWKAACTTWSKRDGGQSRPTNRDETPEEMAARIEANLDPNRYIPSYFRREYK